MMNAKKAPGMALRVATGPASEPISTATAKTHLRVTHSDDDTYIDSLVAAARQYAEHWRGESFINTTWEYFLPSFPAVDYIELPIRPLSSVSSIKYLPVGESSQSTFAATSYTVADNAYYGHGRIVLLDGQNWPTDTLESGAAVEIAFVAGYGAAAANVPDHIKQAILFLVGLWYEERSAVPINVNVMRLPFGVEALLNINRMSFIA